MKAMRRLTVGAGVALLCAVLGLNATPIAAQEPVKYAGRSLAAALRALQAGGLRIVFTSAVVSPDLRVPAEPKGRTPRQQLEEMLEPHGLEARDGPGGTIQIVRRRVDAVPPARATGALEGRVVHAFTAAPLAGVVIRVDGAPHENRTDAAGRFMLGNVEPGRQVIRATSEGYLPALHPVNVPSGATVTLVVRLSPATSIHSEHVTVNGPRPYRKDRGVASESSLSRAEVGRLHGSLADDPVRAVHALPGVWAVDEFRSDFAVRGSPFRHVGLVVDGASAQWLQHTAHGRGATGSLGMLAAPVLESVMLQSGAYPRRYGDRLGPQLELTLREGSRERFRLRGMVGGVNATLLGEGPLGPSRRGSWLVAGRQSFLEWPTERPDSTRTAFGFTDGVAKVVYDVRPGQVVGLSVLSGVSNVDGEDGTSPDGLGDGMNRASLVNLSWRSTFGSDTVFTQRAFLVTQRFLNKRQTGQDGDRGSNQEIAYRADLARPVASGVLEAGVQVSRSSAHDGLRSEAGAGFAGASWARSAYAHFAWRATPRLTLSPGLRVADSSPLREHVVSRWMLGEWAVRSRWKLAASAGVSHQFPDLRQVLGSSGSVDLRPERATHIDLGIERRLTDTVRWRATVFSRREKNILREPDAHPRLVGGRVLPSASGRYANALDGASRGVELTIERQGDEGLSGWASYCYGKSRYTDAERRETYWADFDQRHAFTVFGAYTFAGRTSVGLVYRAGSNFPIPGYVAWRDHQLFVSERRNVARLPAYSRLDLRGDRGFDYLGRQVTVFVEVLNVLDRDNAGRANGSVSASTGEATGFTDSLFRRRASAGIVIDF
jgi:hypothetical protein